MSINIYNDVCSVSVSICCFILCKKEKFFFKIKWINLSIYVSVKPLYISIEAYKIFIKTAFKMWSFFLSIAGSITERSFKWITRPSRLNPLLLLFGLTLFNHKCWACEPRRKGIWGSGVQGPVWLLLTKGCSCDQWPRIVKEKASWQTPVRIQVLNTKPVILLMLRDGDLGKTLRDVNISVYCSSPNQDAPCPVSAIQPPDTGRKDSPGSQIYSFVSVRIVWNAGWRV